MNTTTWESGKYCYVIHGVPYDMRARVAYRRSGRPELHQRKAVKCPYCQERLTDVDISTKVELYRIPAHKTLICQEYRKCFRCKNEVGMILT
jgi:uncharacterized protein with PIN domain